MKYLRICLAILIISIVIAVHELGHAVELWNQEVPIESFAIGFYLPGTPAIKFQLNSIPETTFIISPIILGGYVKTTETGLKIIKEMSYSKHALFIGMGIWMNLVLGFILITIYHLSFNIKKEGWDIKRLGFCITIIIVLVSARKIFLLYLLPILGLVLLATLFRSAIIGPVSIVKSIYQSTKKGLTRIILQIGIISVGLGLFNMLPLFPLDGGKIVMKLIEPYSLMFTTIYMLSSSLLLLYVVIRLLNADFKTIADSYVQINTIKERK